MEKLFTGKQDEIAKLMKAADGMSQTIRTLIMDWDIEGEDYTPQQLDGTAYKMMETAEYLVNAVRKLRELTQWEVTNETNLYQAQHEALAKMVQNTKPYGGEETERTVDQTVGVGDPKNYA